MVVYPGNVVVNFVDEGFCEIGSTDFEAIFSSQTLDHFFERGPVDAEDIDEANQRLVVHHAGEFDDREFPHTLADVPVAEFVGDIPPLHVVGLASLTQQLAEDLHGFSVMTFVMEHNEPTPAAENCEAEL